MKLLIAMLLCAAPALAASRTYELPEETAALADGPGHDLAAANCTGCHSADYVITQPKVPNARAFWTAEVTKMRAAYGAPLEGADMPAIVDYLVATYGK
jgi:mono/diheme cytochrome c family protein